MTTRNSSLMVPKTLTPLSNFDLLDAVKQLRTKHFRFVFMRDQLPQRPNNVETGIINLDNKDGPGTHWVAYAIDPRGIVYFDSYGLAPPVEFLRYVNVFNSRRRQRRSLLWQSPLPTQTLIDPPICGQQELNVLYEISRNPKIPPRKVVHEYTTKNASFQKIAKQFENT